jgi:hypothetical protein
MANMVAMGLSYSKNDRATAIEANKGKGNK